MQEAKKRRWPRLSYLDMRDTLTTLHLWSQIVGKVRLACTPWLNHSWQTPLYVTPRGLSTGLIPHPLGALDLEFDFYAGSLRLRTAQDQQELALAAGSVAGFHAEVMGALDRLGTPVVIHGAPNELPQAIPFARDMTRRPFQATQAQAFHHALLQANRVLGRFRTGFLGKASPVHFFWGSFDLAVTRFSGRAAPPHPGGIPNLPDAVTREAYSHEVSSAGFWPGGPGCEEAVFYAYAYPTPPGFAGAVVRPTAARYDAAMGEFLLPYEAVRTAEDPDALLLDFLASTYAAAADLAGWDRKSLECDLGEPGRPRPV